MSLGRIAQREVDFADPGESVQAAALRMKSRGVGCLVVLDKERKPIGMVTDRDLLIRVVAQRGDPETTRLEEVMSRPVTTAPEEAPIEHGLNLMRWGCFRRLPIVDAAGRLAGLVTLDDILDLLVEEFRDIGKLLEKESPRSFASPAVGPTAGAPSRDRR
jgi:CBS domain-containing protein